MKITVTLAALVLGIAVTPAAAQTRSDLRGPTGQQRVKLPPGVEGATGGGQARSRTRCRVVIRHHRRVRICRPARG